MRRHRRGDRHSRLRGISAISTNSGRGIRLCADQTSAMNAYISRNPEMRKSRTTNETCGKRNNPRHRGVAKRHQIEAARGEISSKRFRVRRARSWASRLTL